MDDWQGRKREPVTEERLMKAVAALAEIVQENGPAFAPLLENIKQELDNLRRLHQPTRDVTAPSAPRKVA
jgi:hypothetical protein